MLSSGISLSFYRQFRDNFCAAEFIELSFKNAILQAALVAFYKLESKRVSFLTVVSL